MDKLVDIRCYITPEYKHQIKRTALEQNISVSRLLYQIICQAIPQAKTTPNRWDDILRKEKI